MTLDASFKLSIYYCYWTKLCWKWDIHPQVIFRPQHKNHHYPISTVGLVVVHITYSTMSMCEHALSCMWCVSRDHCNPTCLMLLLAGSVMQRQWSGSQLCSGHTAVARLQPHRGWSLLWCQDRWGLWSHNWCRIHYKTHKPTWTDKGLLSFWQSIYLSQHVTPKSGY